MGGSCVRPVADLLRDFPSTSSDSEIAAQDEAFWSEIARSFTVDRDWLYLNNGGVSPTGGAAFAAQRAHLEYAQGLPSRRLWKEQKPDLETVRFALASHWGAQAEEVALVRNASEGLLILQNGIPLAAGDEVLTTNQDYPRMLNGWQQRAKREGIVLKQISVPVPLREDADLVRAFERAITPRTRLIHLCQVINLTGQLLPVQAVCRMAHARGIRVLVDGAHGFAHFPFQFSDLECDYYATSLHKWLSAPIGTGLLWMRREHIPEVWPLMAAGEGQGNDIRKFEETGTQPLSGLLAIAQALNLHLQLGDERKSARLRFLRDRWLQPALELPGAQLQTALDHRACAIATLGFEGCETSDLYRTLLQDHRVVVAPIDHPEVQGLRVSPGLHLHRAEVDRFSHALAATLQSLQTGPTPK